MKRKSFATIFLCLLLCFGILCGCTQETATPKVTSTPTPEPEGYNPLTAEEYKLFGAWQLYYGGMGVKSNVTTRINTEEDIPYFTFEDMQEAAWWSFNTSSANFDIDQYPVVLMKYRTDSEEAQLNVEFVSDSTTVNGTYDQTGDGQWQKVVFDLEEIKGDLESLSVDTDNDQCVVFYPFGESVGQQYDVQYIGFFQSMEDANAFDEQEQEEYLKEDITSVDYQEGTEEIVQGYLDDADQRAQEILNTENTVDPAEVDGWIIYVSSINGDDANMGRSEDDAVQSLDRLDELQEMYSGYVTTVLFERGSFWREGGFNIHTNVTYSSYGEGPKPIFSHAVSGKGADKWTQSQYGEHIWEFTGEIDSDVVANICFNGGDAWGVSVNVNSAGEVNDAGIVFNGIETFPSGGGTFESPAYLSHNLEFYYATPTRKLYLYCDYGNPGEYFDDCEMATEQNILVAEKGIMNVVIDNLSFRHSGNHALSFFRLNNFTITNCEIMFAGGGFENGTDGVKMGGGIQNWGDCDGFYVNNCYIWQVFDGALSTQFNGDDGKDVVMQNIDFSDNVIAYCSTGTEIWAYNNSAEGYTDYVKNARVHDNYFLYIGYGMGHMRGSGRAAVFDGECANYDIIYEDNICMFDVGYALNTTEFTNAGAIYRNNVYVMNRDLTYFYRAPTSLFGTTHSTVNKNLRPMWPFTKRYLQHVVNCGIEVGTTFYYTEGYTLPEEEQGAYRSKAQDWPLPKDAYDLNN